MILSRSSRRILNSRRAEPSLRSTVIIMSVTSGSISELARRFTMRN